MPSHNWVDVHVQIRQCLFWGLVQLFPSGDVGSCARKPFLPSAIRIIPSRGIAYEDLAWFLATCPQEGFRNGAEAVSAATKACELSHSKRSGCYDTLAVAYAEAGDSDQAVKYEEQALNDSSLAPKEREEREKRLALFQQRKPFRDEF